MPHKSYLPYALIILIIATASAVFFLRQHGPSLESAPVPLLLQSDQSTATATPSSTASNSNTKNYTSADYGFSFFYPGDMNVGSFDEGEGEMVLVQSGGSDSPPFKGGARGGYGVQLYISPFDEPGPITPDRIKKDLPDEIISNSQTGQLNGEPALQFGSQDDSGGQTVEVWVVHQKNLYRFTAWQSSASVLQQILNSWQW